MYLNCGSSSPNCLRYSRRRSQSSLVMRRRHRLGLHGLRHELGEEAARIVQVFARADRLAAEHRVVLHPGVAVVVDERLELDVELLAVVEQCLVMAGNARRAAVEVEVRVLVELADLRDNRFRRCGRRCAPSCCGRRRGTRPRGSALRNPCATARTPPSGPRCRRPGSALSGIC